MKAYRLTGLLALIQQGIYIAYDPFIRYGLACAAPESISAPFWQPLGHACRRKRRHRERQH